MQRIKVKESYRLDAEALKYDLVITNKQSNLITKVKGASISYIKQLLNSLEAPLRANLKDGEKVFGRTSFSDRMITD
ncbi:hypothetical protein N8Z72_00930 [Polaribacter sp.]|nr:hypothetical protein [Polaribacter sp.]